jgi:hypothetical protein
MNLSPGNGSMRVLPPKFGVTYSVPIRWSVLLCTLLYFISLVPGLLFLRWRCGETCGANCARRWCFHKKSIQRCTWCCNALHVIGAPVGVLVLWSYSRLYYFFKYLYMLPQFNYVLLWHVLLTESLRSFVVVVFVHAQRKVSVGSFVRLCGWVEQCTSCLN